MSYDVHFDPCRGDDGTTETRVNPFTRQPMEVRRKNGLSRQEVQAVSDVLTRAGANPADAHGCRAVRFEDGGSAEVFGRDLGQGCMVALRGMTPAIAQLLFDMMVAGRWVLQPADGATFVIAASEMPTPEGYDSVVVASSPEEVAALLAGGVAAWKKYRDEAIGEDTQRLKVGSLFPKPGPKE